MKNEGGGAVRHLQMSESEIVSSYRTARNPKRQIGILAELNAVSRGRSAKCWRRLGRWC